MSDSTRQEVERYADEVIADFCDNLRQLLDGETIEPEEGYSYSDPLDFINDEALEVYFTAKHGVGQEPQGSIRSFTIVLGTGGPHYELNIKYNGDLEGRAYWGGESATAYHGRCAYWPEWLAELMGVEL